MHLNLHFDSSTFWRNTTETKELCQVFEKLLPYKYYSFNVTAKNMVGEGVSQSISVQTNTDGEVIIGGGNQSTGRKRPICRRSLTNFLSHNVVSNTPHHERESNSQR
jgi:hypothetical protein